MIIRKTRIRTLGSNLRGIREGQEIYVGLQDLGAQKQNLNRAGFSADLEPGESVLPAIVGSTSHFNSEGKYEIHRDQPKEIAYRQIEWTWIEYHGRDNPVEQSDIREVPYERYPRTFIEPPSVELSVAMSADGEKLIVSRPYGYIDANHDAIRHTINLFLELFGECAILDSDLNTPIRAPIKRLNWDVLPPGRLPWERLKRRLDEIVHEEPGGNQPVIERRFEAINAHAPEFVAVGRAGFRGYVIFGFPEQHRYVLESTQTNNATYVFRHDWEHLSTLTKAELLRDQLHEHRVIHRRNWFRMIDRILG